MSNLHYVTDDEAAEEHRQFFDEMIAAGTPVCERGCFIPLPPDGVCRLCEPGQTPRDVNAAYVIYLGHGEERHTFEEIQAAREVVRAYERVCDEVVRDAKTPANGCAACGIVERDHGQRWAERLSYHVWIAPRDERRLDRMLARRAGADMRLWREVNRRWQLREAGEVR
jgi:hypothetical protein